MANGSGQGIPAALLPFLQPAGQGLQASAQAGQTQTPMAGGSPLATPQANTLVGADNAPPTAGGNTVLPYNSNVPTSGTPAQPYQAFLNALQQIQQANPIQSVSSTVPPAHKSAAAQQATMHETGVG